MTDVAEARTVFDLEPVVAVVREWTCVETASGCRWWYRDPEQPYRSRRVEGHLASAFAPGTILRVTTTTETRYRDGERE